MDKKVGQIVSNAWQFVLFCGVHGLSIFGWYYLLTTWGYNFNTRWYTAILLQVLVFLVIYMTALVNKKVDEPVDLANWR